MHENSNQKARDALTKWQTAIQQNIYQIDSDFQHSINFHLSKKQPTIDQELSQFADKVVKELDGLVIENNLAANLPRIDSYDGIGRKIEQIVHHPSYEKAGDIIYSSGLLERMTQPGGLLEALTFMFLSSQVGEGGHNCPIACTAGLIRVLQKMEDFPLKKFYLDKLTAPSYRENFTGAQFLTEIQGGSDVGLNACEANQDENGNWHIKGEKWFCSNADAELILLTARFDQGISGTKGLGLFLVPARLESGERNFYTLRRLKDKIGTRSMASAEIDFCDALAMPVGNPANGFKMVMENVLHISRLFNTFCVLGMARRAYHIALEYARHRFAFGSFIVNYPLVKDTLTRIKVENTALLASIFATVDKQDQFDQDHSQEEESKLLLRLLANLNKYLSSLWSVEHIHHSLDILAGNGAIESFSVIPRLFRDSIVCENWEGTHNILRMQTLRDILRYQIDVLFLQYLEDLLISVNSEEKYLSIFRFQIEKLKTELESFKNSSDKLQSLQIKFIVDRMSILHGGIHLFLEGLHQSKTGNPSKLKCLDFYILLHLQNQNPEMNEYYLNLIDELIPDKSLHG